MAGGSPIIRCTQLDDTGKEIESIREHVPGETPDLAENVKPVTVRTTVATLLGHHAGTSLLPAVKRLKWSGLAM